MDDDEINFKLAKFELKEAVEGLRKFEGESLGPPYCSFCQRGKGQYLCCIEGRSNVRICDACVVEAYDMVAEDLKQK